MRISFGHQSFVCVGETVKIRVLGRSQNQKTVRIRQVADFVGIPMESLALPSPSLVRVTRKIQYRIDESVIRICLSCKQLFTTDPRNHHHQRFCARARCRKASKILSQKQWLAKPGNRKLGGGPGEVERVRIWRKANPYYWKRTFPLFRRC